MASLTASTFKASGTFSFSKAVGTVGNIAFGPTTVSYSLAPALTIANNAYVATMSLAASATVDIDLILGLDPYGVALASTMVVGMILVPTGTGGILKFQPGASNGLLWFMGAVGDTNSIPSGGEFSYIEPAGHVVDSTHKIITFTNTGTGPLTAQVIILVKT